MKKIKFFAILFAAIALMSVAANAAAPAITAETAVLMDAKTGQVIYDKDMHRQMYPASITKILTTILAVENLALDDKIIVSQEAVDAVSRNASHIALTKDEEITVREAVYAALLASANDACNVIAEKVSGSMDAFAKLMTEKAAECGALGTNFTNSNGLKDENHYTTAYDMAMMTRYGLQNETWRDMFGERRYEMPVTNKQDEIRYLNNQHIMIFEKAYYYDGIIGGKTGYTTVAKHTLVTAAERDGVELIAVVMKCPQNMDKYEDTKALLDYGFENFKPVTVTDESLTKSTIETDDGQIEVSLEAPINVLIPKDASEEAIVITTEIKDDTPYASLTLPQNAGDTPQELGEYPLKIVATQAVAEETPHEESGIGIFRIILIVILSVVALLALFVLIIYVRKEIYLWKRRRARKAYRRRQK